MSNHKVEVIEVKLQPHPNADSLSIVKVFDGYTACVRTADWQDGMLGAYIPPDSVVDTTRPEFSFLGEHRRIKVKKLRGVVSMGLLIHAPAGAQIGDDVAEHFGVKHYDPPMPISSGGEVAKAPSGIRPCYDVESLRRYAAAFVPGEPVWVTEKIHGANARFCFSDGEMHCGSRTEWKRRDESNLWWRALSRYPELRSYCEMNPDVTVYGEVYGQVQDLRYGTARGELRIAVFDLLCAGKWIDPFEAKNTALVLPWVPLIESRFPFDLQTILAMAEGPSLIAGAKHVREGIVVKPMQERWHESIGRVNLKVVGNGYLERA